MGLDANVMCNCWRDGKTSAPPVPRDWLEMDDEGYLSVKREYRLDVSLSDIFAWEHSCCPHEGMELARERISNWPGVRLFQQVLSTQGQKQFPMLISELPSANGGLTDSVASARALEELDQFEATERLGEKTVLLDSETGEIAVERVEAYEGFFMLSGGPGYSVSLGKTHLEASQAQGGQVIFRSKRLRQFRKDGAPVQESRNEVVWQDLDSGAVLDPAPALSGPEIPWENGEWRNELGEYRFSYPALMHVEIRPWMPADFNYILEPLRIVFSASVESGNPVRWC